MDLKEYKAIQRRMAYRRYIDALPRCDQCENVMFVGSVNGDRRVCLLEHEIIDGRTKTCPEWCPKRREQ